MIVMKFGGTSMGTSESILQVAEIVKGRISQKPVVVVSAMSGVTDLLLESANFASKNDFVRAKEKVEKIKLKHLEAIEKMIKNKEVQNNALKYIEKEIETLNDLLNAVEILGDIPVRAHDAIVAMGEKLSAKLLPSVLVDQGIDSINLNLENVIHDKKRVPDEQFFLDLRKAVSEKVGAELKKGKIPVLTGFIGRVPEGIVKTIGRGYSDYTASLVGAELNAKRLEIWTDVDGIFTADPRKVENTKIVNEVSYDEAAQMAHFGAKVLHPRTINPAVEKGIPTYILNTFNSDFEGTCICKEVTNKFIKSITSKRHISIVNVSSNRKLMPHMFISKVFEIVSKYGISVDAVSITQETISFASDSLKEIKKSKKEFEEIGTFHELEENALIAIVGSGMKGRSGVAGKVFSILGEKKINIEMISQGASEINITFLIKQDRTEDVIKTLHEELFNKK